MSELKAYKTNPFEKQEIKISVQTLKEIDLVLFQLLLEERRDSVREDNPRGRRKKGAYITRHLSLGAQRQKNDYNLAKGLRINYCKGGV